MVYLSIVLLLLVNVASATEFSSGEARTTVVQLYTSEGCSSCPPADKWLSSLKTDPRLFKSVIPMAFHVDYWDYLGWKDPWSKAEFSQRQRQLADKGGFTAGGNPLFAGLFSQVYTPAFLVADQEWVGWQRTGILPDIKQPKVGVLSAELTDNNLTVNYSKTGEYKLNIAYLGVGLASDVKAGENRAKHLEHDFVVLNHIKKNGHGLWQVKLPAIPKQGQKRTALSIWITQLKSLKVEQATAAYLD